MVRDGGLEISPEYGAIVAALKQSDLLKTTKKKNQNLP